MVAHRPPLLRRRVGRHFVACPTLPLRVEFDRGEEASLTLPPTDLRDKMPPFEVVRSRRGARVDESTCLESMRLGNGTVGSNPTLSAIS